jgi:hypothetical protein
VIEVVLELVVLGQAQKVAVLHPLGEAEEARHQKKRKTVSSRSKMIIEDEGRDGSGWVRVRVDVRFGEWGGTTSPPTLRHPRQLPIPIQYLPPGVVCTTHSLK